MGQLQRGWEFYLQAMINKELIFSIFLHCEENGCFYLSYFDDKKEIEKDEAMV